jgi:hypothetical protein
MIHISTCTGSRSVRIVDMTNAGKRGKVCRVIHDSKIDGFDTFHQMTRTTGNAIVAMSFDDAASMMPETADLEEIRGVDAPLPRREVMHDNFSLTLDTNGAHLRDNRDQINWPTTITSHRQNNRTSYMKALKVWDKLKAATTYYECVELMSDAGCVLHSYCAMD